ncbi:DUF6531 domain-containing protein [Kitasatospora griseola]|uniref:DUF6531 domain-containing protein n=1 Tax=Kitasatospora griseola TaxID=2064 RepID=UPI00365CB9F5
MSNQIVKALEHGAQKLGETLAEDAGKALKNFYRKAGDNLKTVAKNTREIEAKHVKDLEKIFKGDGKDALHHPRTGTGKSTGHETSRPGHGNTTNPRSPRLRDGAANPRKTAVPAKRRNCRSDPVDIASGEMVMQHEDIDLPGVLPLLLTRTHVSSYRSGHWFGRSWASTLDQRLELDQDGVVFATADGMLLVYPMPAPGEPALPVEGPRLPLTRGTEAGTGITVSDPFKGLTLHFDSPGGTTGPENSSLQLPLRAITDRNGNRIDIDYSAAGVPVEVRHSGGYRIAIESTGTRITAYRLIGAGPSVESPDAPLAGFRYDGNGNLTDILDAAGIPLRLTYDEAGRVTSWTGRGGFRYRYVYDRSGRCVQTRGEQGILDAVFSYDLENRVTTVRDSLGNLTVYRLNEAGQTVSETDPLGAVTTFEWDRRDGLLSQTDPLGRTTSYEYDVDGNLVAVGLPDGTRSTAVFNDLHLPVQATQPDGAVWQYEYDERGNLLVTTAPNGGQTRCSYGEHGRLETVTDALGHTTMYTTDAAGLILAVTDALGGVTTSARDVFGRAHTVTDALGGVTTRGWTADGLLAWRTGGDGRTEHWRYDARGDLVEHRNADNRVTAYEYGPFGMPTARTGPDGVRYEFTHDTELRLTAVTGPQGAQWCYEFDPAGNLIGERDFNGRSLRYGYDAAGQLVERVNGAGQSVRYTRDGAGRVVESRSADGTATSFGYDSAGRMLRAATTDSVVEFDYDALGQVIRERSDGRSVSNEYDLLGRPARRVTPSGVVSEWTYDGNGLPSRLTTDGEKLAFQHDALGRETARHFGTSVALTKSWDTSHRLAGQALWGADAAEASGYRQIQGRSWSYRADGHPVAVTDELAGDRAFDLDAVGRVTAVRAETWTETYAYDAAGNVTHADFPAPDGDSQGEREVAGTLVNRAGRTRYEHDGQGRVVRTIRRSLSGQAREWRYTWAAEDRLVRADTPDGRSWVYRYDALGRRVSKTCLAPDGSVVEQALFSWDGTNLAERLVQLPGLERATTWDWEPSGYRAATQVDRSWRIAGATREEIDRRFHAIVTDLAGAPAELVTADGEIAWRTIASLWGRPIETRRGDIDCPLGFPGQYRDAETGLDYNLARYYDADTASYLSPDPLGLEPAPNHHRYVANPLWWTDPLGLKGKSKGSGNEPRRIYDDSEYDKHGSASGSSGKGEVSRAPSNGQAALDRSIDMDPNNPDVTRRLGVDHGSNEIVVLDRHREITDAKGNVTEVYHGHVQSKYPSKSVTQGDLTKLKKAGMIDNIKKQRVLPPPKPCEE